jgi:hypothetical protein
MPCVHPSFKGAGAAVKDYRPLTLGATPEVESVAGARDLLKVNPASSGVKKNSHESCQGDNLDSFGNYPFDSLLSSSEHKAVFPDSSPPFQRAITVYLCWFIELRSGYEQPRQFATVPKATFHSGFLSLELKG